MATLQCEGCQLEFPIDKFPDLGRGLVCEHCLAGEDQKAAQRKLMAKTQEMANRVLDAQGIDDILPKVRTVLAEVYSQFGGPRAFASKVVWMIEELSRRKPIPPSAAQLMINLMKLHHVVDESDQEASLKNMSIEQLRREQEVAMMQLAVEAAGDPRKRDALFKMLERYGFNVSESNPEERYGELVRSVNQELTVSQENINDRKRAPSRSAAGDADQQCDVPADAGAAGDRGQADDVPAVGERDLPGVGVGGDSLGDGPRPGPGHGQAPEDGEDVT